MIIYLKLYRWCGQVVKFGNSGISMNEVIITLNFIRIRQENLFFDAWSWLKFINLRLVLGTALKFHSSVVKGLKLEVIKFWRLIPTLVTGTAQKLEFSVKDFFSKCAQIAGNCGFCQLLKKSLMEEFTFCAVRGKLVTLNIPVSTGKT